MFYGGIVQKNKLHGIPNGNYRAFLTCCFVGTSRYIYISGIFRCVMQLQRQIGIVVFLTVKSHLCQTMREGQMPLLRSLLPELYFCHDQRGEGGVKNIQLDGQGIICGRSGKAFFESGMLQRNQIASLGDHAAVSFFPVNDNKILRSAEDCSRLWPSCRCLCR